MSEHTLKAVFPDALLAESAIGRLEVLGIPPPNIIKSPATGPCVAVSAKVEDRLVEKARDILRYG